MLRRDRSLLDEIERGALDDSAPLPAILRKCIALGGQTRNAELRDWASRELNGYRNDNEIPEYRTIHAALTIDGATFTHLITGQQISVMDLPDFAREHLSEEVKLAHGVSDLHALLRNAERANGPSVKMAPAGSADLVKLMNYQIRKQDPTQAIHRLYWEVNIARIEGVLGQIRTTLVGLVSEMRAVMTDDASMPSSEAAAQAVNVVLHKGKRHQITVNTAQANDGATASVTPASERRESGWTKTAAIWTVIAAIVAIIGAYIAYRQWRG